MRFSKITEDLFANSTATSVLRTLIGRPQRAFTGRELSRESGTPIGRTIERLRVLQSYGLVEGKEVGRAHTWKMIGSHALLPPLRAWFQAERSFRQRLIAELRQHFMPIQEIRRAVLFGSVARGDEGPSSDIDVLIEVETGDEKPRTRESIEVIAREVRATFTNPLRALIYTKDELSAKRELAFLRALRKEGIVLVQRQPPRVERLHRAKAQTFRRKSEDFASSMELVAKAGKWHSLGLTAVHAVISSADALTTHFLGKRSRASDHEEVIDLLQALPLPEAKARASQALEVLRAKNAVEYEARDFEETEATALQRKAERFVAWALSEIDRVP